MQDNSAPTPTQLKEAYETWKQSKQDTDRFEFEKLVVAALKSPSLDHSPFLCEVLDEHNLDLSNNEDIIELLGECGDKQAVPSLVRAMNWQPVDDEFGDISLKSIWALKQLNTPEGNAAIQEYVARTPYDRIKEMYAK
jgi:hypothetical protein